MHGVLIACLLCSLTCSAPTNRTVPTRNLHEFKYDISIHVNPIYDGYIESILLVDHTYVLVKRGTAQIVYDATIFQCSPFDDAGKSPVIHLGPNSKIAKEGGAYHQFRSYVGFSLNHGHIVNILCYADFPARSTPQSGRLANNVMLYNHKTKELHMLTSSDGQNDTQHEAVYYDPDDDLILMREYKQIEGERPSIGRFYVYRLEDKSTHDVWEYLRLNKRLKNAVELYEADPISTDPISTDHLHKYVKWEISSETYQKALLTRRLRELNSSEIVPLSDEYFCIIADSSRILLMRYDGSDGYLLGHGRMLSYDTHAKQLYLRIGVIPDDNGQYQYSVFDFGKFRLSVETRPQNVSGESP